MRIQRMVPVLMALSFGVSCGARGPEPHAVLPPDSDVRVAISAPETMVPRLRPVLDRLPEAAGFADLVRSLLGIDLLEPARTRADGLDPGRGLAGALWRDALLVVAPVRDGSLAARRAGLRLARLGFVQESSVGGLGTFHDVRDPLRKATLRVASGLMVVCVGRADSCLSLGPPADPSGEGGAWRDGVRREMARPDADVVVLVGNSILMRWVRESLGMNLPTGAAGAFVAAALGDLRGVLSIAGGFGMRAAIGAGGDPLAEPTVEEGGKTDHAASIRIDLQELGPLVARTIMDACGRRCVASGGPAASRVVSAWSGRAYAEVHAVKPARSMPVVDVGAVLGNLSWDAAFESRTAGDAVAMLRWAGAMLGMAAGKGDDSDPDLVTTVTGVLPEAAARIAGRTVVLAAGPGAVSRLPGKVEGSGGGLPGLVARERAGLQIIADPGRILVASGVTAIDFLTHLVTAVEEIRVDAAWQDGRLGLDTTVRIRGGGAR